MQAIRDYITTEDSSLLSFRKNDIIRLVNKSYTPHGWLRGQLNGRKGLFPIEYVKYIGRYEPEEIRRPSIDYLQDEDELTETIDDDFLSPLNDDDHHHQHQPAPKKNLAMLIEESRQQMLQNENMPSYLFSQDGHFSMMEFAMMNFRQSIDK